MEQTLISFFHSAPYVVSFLAGILTFFSPCVLPLIPAYISYISGLSVKELGTQNSVSWSLKLKILRSSAMFVFGFSMVFVTLGAIMAQLVEDVFAYEWVSWIAGGIIILFGLHIAGFLSFNFLNLEKRATLGDTTKAATSLFAPFILGVSFALGWTPCIGPIFTAIVSMAATDSTNSLLLMSIYAIGLGIPFILTALLTSQAFRFFNRIKAHFFIIEKLAGILLILVGIAIALGGLTHITALIMGGF